MTREEHLKFCAVCTKRAFNPKFGTICSLTNEVAAFEGSCPEYVEDTRESEMQALQKAGVKEETNKQLNRGRVALFLLSALYILTGVWEGFYIEGHALVFGIVDWVIAGIFLGLGIWSYREPRWSMIIGLGLYILIILLLAAIEPSTLFQGIVWKILALVSLAYGIQTAQQATRNKKVEHRDILDQI